MPNLALTILGVAQTAATIEGMLQQRITDLDAAEPAHAAWLAAAATARETLKATAPVIAATRAYVRIQYENDATAMADFGMKPRNVTPMTAAQKAAANAKRQATRAARGEVSKAKKAAAAAAASATPAEPPAATPATAAKPGV